MDPHRLFAASALYMKGLYVTSNVIALADYVPISIRLNIMKITTGVAAIGLPFNVYKLGVMAIWTNYQTMFWYMIISVSWPFGSLLWGLVENFLFTDIDEKYIIWRGFVCLPASLYSMAFFYRFRLMKNDTLYLVPALTIQIIAAFWTYIHCPRHTLRKDKHEDEVVQGALKNNNLGICKRKEE